jgi:5-formyltetrahydrofolate cyclo-ligase
MTDVYERKAAQREEIRRRIGRMGPAARAEADRRLREKLLAELDRLSPGEEAPAPRVLAYVPLSDEVDLRPLLAELLRRGWPLSLPRVASDDRLMLHAVRSLDEDLVMGRWSILEPRKELPVVLPVDLDIVVVPGRGFDTDGGRLGRGKAYYDRMLRKTRAARIAVAYETQILEDLATDASDERVDRILTPERTILPPGRRAAAPEEAGA